MLVALCLAATLSHVPAPEAFFASSERWSYTGTIQSYNSLADAQSGRNPRTPPIAIPERDGVIYVVRNRPSFYEDFNGFLSFWSYNNGQNRTNKNEGFIQMYDENASNWQNQKAHFSKNLKNFTVTCKGKNATYPSPENPEDYARLWNAGAPQGSGETTKGAFLQYEYSLTAFDVNASDPDKDGFYENTKNASRYEGTFTGIFKNESNTSPASRGFYVVKLLITNNSAALGEAKPDRFGSSRKQ